MKGSRLPRPHFRDQSAGQVIRIAGLSSMFLHRVRRSCRLDPIHPHRGPRLKYQVIRLSDPPHWHECGLKIVWLLSQHRL